MAVLRTKAKAVMAEDGFPKVEKVLYSECATEANTPVKLAKCVVKILNAFNPGKAEQEAWMDLILEITGAGRRLDDLIGNLTSNINQIKFQIYPAIRKMEDLENRFNILKQTFSKDQREQLRINGYTFMDSDQMAFIHGNKNLIKNFPKTKNEHEKKLENDIRNLAELDKEFEQDSEVYRFKREDSEVYGFKQKDSEVYGFKREDSEIYRSKREDSEIEKYEFQSWNVLRPWAFVNRMNETVVWEATILSPHSFSSEYLVPDALTLELLSPRAFKSAVLSPAVLFSRILSPLAFGAEILSPRAFAAFVLSPQILIAEVLSPHFFETHIASPDALTIQVLNPNIFAPRIGSPDFAGILVLSPNVFSPRILSPEKMLVEILSPHILGGEETEEEEENNFHQESDLPEKNEKFAIPLVEKEVSRDSTGNFVPKVIRDSKGRIKKASGLIKGGNLPEGDRPSKVMITMVGSSRAKYIQQIIPNIWGGGSHLDNLIFPSQKQIKTKSYGVSKLDLEIADHLTVSGNSIIFCFDYKYDGPDVIPSKTRKYIDVVHENGNRLFFRNGIEYNLVNSPEK